MLGTRTRVASLVVAVLLVLGLAAAIAAGGRQPAGDPGRGKQVFNRSGCAACHTLAAAHSTGTVGPNLDTSLKRDAKRAGQPPSAFVRQSIVAPNAFVAPGFPAGVMPRFSHLTRRDLDGLVAFVVTRSRSTQPDLGSMCLRAGDLPGSTVARQQAVSQPGYSAAFERDFTAGRIGASHLHAAVCRAALAGQTLAAGLLFSQTAGELLGAHPGVGKLLTTAFPALFGTSSRFGSITITRRRKLTAGDQGVELAATVRASGTQLGSGAVTVGFSLVYLQVGWAVGSLSLLGEPGSQVAAPDVAAAAGAFAKRMRSGLAAAG